MIFWSRQLGPGGGDDFLLPLFFCLSFFFGASEDGIPPKKTKPVCFLLVIGFAF